MQDRALALGGGHQRGHHLRRYLTRREPTTVGLTQADHRIQRGKLPIDRLVADVDRSEQHRLRRVGQRRTTGARHRTPPTRPGR